MLIVVRVIDPSGHRWAPIEMPCVPRVGEKLQDLHGITFRIDGVTYVPSGRWKGEKDMWDYDYIQVQLAA